MIKSVSEADLKKTRRMKGARELNGRMMRLPPHSKDMEQGCLGCQITNQTCIDKATEIGITADSYYEVTHQTIQSELFAMRNAQETVNEVTFCQRLADKKILDKTGGIEYIDKLLAAVPSVANFSYYTEKVLEKQLLRKLLDKCHEVAGRIYEFEGEVDALIDEVERDMLAIRPRKTTEATELGGLVSESMAHIEELHNRRGAISGLSTGLIDLDRMTDGFHGGEKIVVAAFPGIGKTSLALNIVEHVALELHKSVGVFTLEMSAKQLITRCICSHAKVNLRNVSKGFLADTDFQKLTDAAGKISKAKILFDDSSDLTVYELRARARRWQQEHKIELIVIDYIQLLSAPANGKQRTETEELAEVSRGIKNMAKELNIPVIAMSQLTSLSNGKTRLRGSANIGQDADIVMRLDNVKKAEETSGDAEGHPVKLRILKQRNGPTGTIDLVFLKHITRFENASKISDEDVPSEE